MLKIISDNPFRILGVWSNSPLRDIVSNRNRINAFSKVGKQCDFPTDLSNLCGAVERTPESLQQADSALTIDADKLKYAQFWLMKGSPVDEQAVKLASEGAVDRGLLTLERQQTVSSLQNSVVLNLMRGNVREATRAFARLYDGFASEFILALGLGQGSATDMLNNYVGEVMADGAADTTALIGSDFPASWNEAVKEIVAKPFIQQLEDAITEAKKSKEESPLKRLSAGRKLSRTAKPILMKLRQMLTTNDLKLTNISDKVGNEVLQCAIDFYNGSNDLAAAKDAIPVAKDARMIVMGSMARQRCDENIKILQDNADQAPPTEVASEVSRIQAALSTYNAAPNNNMDKIYPMLDVVLPALGSIRNKMGAQAPIYVTWSTAVAHSVLNVVIDVVNELQNKVNQATPGTALFRGFLERYKKALNDAIVYLGKIKPLGMDAECRQRLNTNSATLDSLFKNAINADPNGGSGGDSDSKWGNCLVQCLIYGAIMFLFKLCS